jgi:hypothetical protein
MREIVAFLATGHAKKHLLECTQNSPNNILLVSALPRPLYDMQLTTLSNNST